MKFAEKKIGRKAIKKNSQGNYSQKYGLLSKLSIFACFNIANCTAEEGKIERNDSEKIQELLKTTLNDSIYYSCDRKQMFFEKNPTLTASENCK